MIHNTAKSLVRTAHLPRLRRATLALGLAAVFILAGCADLSMQGAEASYPRFSLTGAPDREVDYTLNITGPDMAAMSTQLSGTEGRTVIEVPAGRNRTFEFLANDDVYSGRVTRSLAAGREIEVTVPILPGPVFVDATGGGNLGLPESRVQIRDLNINLDALDNTIRWSAFDGAPSRDAQYSADGRLWFFEADELAWLVGISDFSETEPYSHSVQLTGVLDADIWLSLSVDTATGRFAIGNDSGLLGVGNLTDDVLDEAFNIEASFTIEGISGLEFGPDNTLFLVADIYDEISDPGFDGVALVKIDLTGAEAAVYEPLPHFQTVPGYDAVPAWADLRVINEEVLVISGLADDGNSAVYRYDTDLQLLGEFGTTTTENDPDDGEFWGPRRFAGTRDGNELIVIDQQDGDSNGNSGPGRLVRFNFGTTDGWQTFGEGEFGFFDTSFDTAVH